MSFPFPSPLRLLRERVPLGPGSSLVTAVFLLPRHGWCSTQTRTNVEAWLRQPLGTERLNPCEDSGAAQDGPSAQAKQWRRGTPGLSPQEGQVQLLSAAKRVTHEQRNVRL